MRQTDSFTNTQAPKGLGWLIIIGLLVILGVIAGTVIDNNQSAASTNHATTNQAMADIPTWLRDQINQTAVTATERRFKEDRLIELPGPNGGSVDYEGLELRVPTGQTISGNGQLYNFQGTPPQNEKPPRCDDGSDASWWAWHESPNAAGVPFFVQIWTCPEDVIFRIFRGPGGPPAAPAG